MALDYRKLTNITIPDSVTAIGDNAFASCKSLKQITVQNVGQVSSLKNAGLDKNREITIALGEKKYTYDPIKDRDIGIWLNKIASTIASKSPALQQGDGSR